MNRRGMIDILNGSGDGRQCNLTRQHRFSSVHDCLLYAMYSRKQLSTERLLRKRGYRNQPHHQLLHFAPNLPCGSMYTKFVIFHRCPSMSPASAIFPIDCTPSLIYKSRGR